MRYEVEQKFYVDRFDEVELRLREMNAEFRSGVEQVDYYFAHPHRDFAVTDEAFRLRCAGDNNWITYKGPRVDAITKTRRELELTLPGGSQYREQFTTLLEHLGFRLVAAVRKQRRKAFVPWGQDCVEVSLDEVDQVGTFVELEIMADEDGLSAARGTLQSLAAQLSLSRSERRSYLDLLLAVQS